jgi:hypothetical protein
MAGNMNLFSPPDMEIIKKLSETPKVGQVVVFVMQHLFIAKQTTKTF